MRTRKIVDELKLTKKKLEDVAERIIKEIDTLEEIIEETLAGRHEQAEEMLRDDFE